MQNRFADPEGAGLFLCDGILARICAIEHVDLTFLANRTESERFMFRGIDGDRLIVTVLAEIEHRLEILAQFDDRIELAADLASKSFERSDATFQQKFL